MPMTNRWGPHVTVAVVIEQHGRYLLVEEYAEPQTMAVFNQPAGHLEDNESLISAAQRETLEETGVSVEITAFLGISRYLATNGETYLRFSFVGQVLNEDPMARLDDGIIRTHWLTRTEIEARQHLLRSPLVLNDIMRYERGERHSITIIHDHPQTALL
jgi:ADP-ribose pyrophosphatase YjhB (NUDIX family)